MSSPKRICVFGCGVMGTALVKGWLKSAQQQDTEFALYTRRASSEEKLKSTLSNDVLASGRVKVYSGDAAISSIDGSDIVLLGFLPGDAAAVLGGKELRQALDKKLVISMLAGVATSSLQSHLSKSATQESTSPEVVRLIPTIAAEVGQSATIIATSDQSPSKGALETTEKLFSSIGSTLRVPEHLMDEATAIGATVHALAIVAVDSATDASVCSGVPRSTASALVVQALQSAVGLMLNGEMEPAAVKTAMSTPGGITINAIAKLDASARPGVADAVKASIQHTKSMG